MMFNSLQNTQEPVWNAYPPNLSDQISNNFMITPSLSNGLPFNQVYDNNTTYNAGITLTPWQHTVPTHFQWTIPASQSKPMVFTGVRPNETPACSLSSNSSPLVSPVKPSSAFYKRKAGSTDSEFSPQNKMYLTEEKMAQRLHGLHISNEYTDHEFSHYSQDNPPQRKTPAKSLQELEERLSDYLQEFELEEAPSNNETFHLPPELQKTISQSDLILPQEIFKELNKPCLEIVLWKPSSDLVKETVKTFTKSEPLTSTSEKTNNNNNNTLQQGESPEVLTAILRHPVTNMDFLLPNFPASASNNDDTMDL